MKRCSKSKACAGAVSGLPDDPLVEILSRVPAKSVCRFKCVSKAWRDLITHPDHRKKLRQPMQGLFVQTAEFSEVDGSFRYRCGFIDLTSRPLPLDIDPCFSFLKVMAGKTFLLDSCNGLNLLGHLQGYIVCNPTTKQWLAVPPCGSHERLSHNTYLAFDPALSSHFHLFQFPMPDFEDLTQSLHVYSSETGTWSQNQIFDEQKEQGQLEGWHRQFKLDPDDHYSTFFNGFLHIIFQEQILAIDVKGKAIRVIALPHEHSSSLYLGQSQGHLHYVAAHPLRQKLSIWVLQDYDTQEWVFKNTVDFLDIFGETSGTIAYSDYHEVVDIHQDCNVIFIIQRFLGYKLIAYDMDRKVVSVISTFEVQKSRSQFARYIPYFSESPALTNKH